MTSQFTTSIHFTDTNEPDVTVRYCHTPASPGDHESFGFPAEIEIYEVTVLDGTDILASLSDEQVNALELEAWSHHRATAE